jgi:hypothetical protein
LVYLFQVRVSGDARGNGKRMFGKSYTPEIIPNRFPHLHGTNSDNMEISY